MTAGGLAALAEDPEAVAQLTDMYLAGYLGGTVTALVNVPVATLDGTVPQSGERWELAVAMSNQLLHEMQEDPAVRLTLERGVIAILRGEAGDPGVIRLAGA